MIRVASTSPLRNARTFSVSRPARMPSSNPNDANAAGLTPQESKGLAERQPRQEEQAIVSAIKELYSCKPKEDSYHMYAPEAIFHDPVGIAKGVSSIRAQFNGLAKMFPLATIPKFRVLDNPSSLPKSTILIDQDVAYYRDPSKEPTKVVNSLLTIERNEAGAITKHTEEWDHRKETTSDDGFLGSLNEWRKAATANVTELFVSQKPPSK